MTLSIKGGGGIINEVPKVSGLKVTAFEMDTIDIEYKVEDVELTICRHYLLLNGVRTEITKQVGYESSTNIFKYQITGLKLNTPYTIQIRATDGHDEGLSKAIQQTTKNGIVYGVRVMENNSNPSSCITYIEEAVGVTPANSTSLGGWADKWPFKDIRMVGLKNGAVTKEINPNKKTHYKDGSVVPHDVDVMVEFPKIYWNFTNISNGYELRISNAQMNSNYVCLAHKVGGLEKDYIYIGAYLGYNEGGKLRSISGVRPTIMTPMAQFRQYAHNVGDGYQQFNWFTLILSQNLYLIAYKNLNSQQALGYGYANYDHNNNGTNTGGTNTKGMIYGESGGKQQICFLGIEDFYGNLSQWVDGIKIDGSCNTFVTPDNKIFNDNASGYKNIGRFTNESIHGKISKVAHTNEGGFFPRECNGSETTYYCDYAHLIPNYVTNFGGDYDDKLEAGAFNLNLDAVASNQYSVISSRLCYLG